MLSPDRLVARGETIRRLIRPPPTLLGFNMNIDWVVRTWELETPITIILRQMIDDEVLPKETEEIFLEGFTKGVAREIVFPSYVDMNVVEDYGLIGTARIGGQVGLMAGYASELFPSWRIYAFLPGKTNDWGKAGIKIPKIEWIPFHLEGLRHIPIHIVLEFRKGQVIETEDGTLSCHGDNRVILSSEPDSVRSHELVERVIDTLNRHKSISSLIFAGMHLPWLNKTLDKIIEVVKDKKPDSFIHLEVTHFESDGNSDMGIWRNVDSIGFNEQEASLLTGKTKGNVTSKEEEFQQNVTEIAQTYPWLRLHGHTKGLYALRDSCMPAKQIEEMLLSATTALMVAGQYQTTEGVEWNHVSNGEFLAIDHNAEVSFFRVPTLVNPVFTVGLGDAISIAALARHLSE